MPAKKKLKTIFKSDEDFDNFIYATVADCATLGMLLIRAGEDPESREIANDGLKVVKNRIRLIMGEQARRFKNGDAEDILGDYTDEELEDYEKDLVEFTKKVFEGKKAANADGGRQPEVSDGLDTSNSKMN